MIVSNPDQCLMTIVNVDSSVSESKPIYCVSQDAIFSFKHKLKILFMMTMTQSLTEVQALIAYWFQT